MRIVFYTPFVPMSHTRTSGDVVTARNLVDALARQGHAISVLPDFSTEAALGSWAGKLHIPAVLRRIRRTARSFRPDAWLTYYSDSIAPDIPGALLAHGLGARYILYGAVKRGPAKGSRRPRLSGRILNQLALRAADRVVVLKDRDLEGLQSHAWLRPKLSQLRPAISVADFRPDQGRRAQIRQRLNIADKTVVLLAAARLTYRGGGRKLVSLQFLIDCVIALNKPHQEVRLLIAGDGKARPELEQRAGPVRDGVTFLGAVAHEDMGALYNAADVFCFPGLREAMGMVYLEAQASGLPVVAFRNGGIPEIVRDGETGYLVSRMDKEKFVAALERLISDSALRQRLGAAGIAHVCANHDLDKWGAAMSALLENEALSPVRQAAPADSTAKGN